VRLAGLVIAAVLAGPTSAHARPEVVGLLDVRGVDVSDVVLETFAEAVDEGLAGAEAFQPASRDRMHEMLAQSSWSAACVLGECLAEVRAQTGAGYVVTAGLSASGESYRFVITLIETEKGEVVRQVSDTCPACTVEDLASAATLATIELINNVEPEGPVDDAGRVAVLEHRAHGHKVAIRRATLLVIGAGILTGSTAAYFVHKGRTDVGYPLLGATAGLAVSGAVMLGLSFRF
jgi:hypothetical protein